MNGLRVVVVAVIALAVGLVAYQMGLSQGLVTTIPAGAAPVAYYAYPHWGFGFGFLGLLFPLFFLFLIFGALRAAMWGGRGGYGGKGWGGNGRARIEELHRELHGEKPAAGDRPSSTST
ncbi:MAG: hypothetical protein M3O80_04945 [Chloroflexota bacterium]|nr:hypothetical protein [Chloroflexota bacterium]